MPTTQKPLTDVQQLRGELARMDEEIANHAESKENLDKILHAFSLRLAALDRTVRTLRSEIHVYRGEHGEEPPEVNDVLLSVNGIRETVVENSKKAAEGITEMRGTLAALRRIRESLRELFDEASAAEDDEKGPRLPLEEVGSAN
jgi:chromosome segregation ATPase